MNFIDCLKWIGWGAVLWVMACQLDTYSNALGRDWMEVTQVRISRWH